MTICGSAEPRSVPEPRRILWVTGRELCSRRADAPQCASEGKETPANARRQGLNGAHAAIDGHAIQSEGKVERDVGLSLLFAGSQNPQQTADPSHPAAPGSTPVLLAVARSRRSASASFTH